MAHYVAKIKHDDNTISVCFYIEQNKIMELGEKINAINENAYMNGYNWGAVLDYYLEQNHPELVEGMDSDPEAGMYVALYDSKDEKKADQLIKVIEGMIENENNLLAFIKKEGENIEWD